MLKEWKINGTDHQFDWTKVDDTKFSLTFEEENFDVEIVKTLNEHKHIVSLNGRNYVLMKSGRFVSIENINVDIVDCRERKRSGGADSGQTEMSSPMPGKILKVLVAQGDQVKTGQGLLVMEAMKMEHTIKAAYDGVIEKVFFKEGDLVDGGVDLVELLEETE